MEISDDNGRWVTNTGKFETQKKAKMINIGLPEFSNKRIIEEAEMSINPSKALKYKAIFGLDFLISNVIDFINSQEMIMWQGTGISMLRDKQELETNPNQK